MSVGQRLRDWRGSQNLSQQEAADRAGLSQAAWQKLETTEPKRIGLDLAARVVDVTKGQITLVDLSMDGELVRRATALTMKRERKARNSYSNSDPEK